MKAIFIELTGTDDTKIFVNLLHIGRIETSKKGSIIISNLINRSSSKEVKESYDDIKSLIGSVSSQQ
jgi:hypothetical protein